MAPKTQRLDERAQEAFVEARIIIWAQAPDDKVARYTAEKLAATLSAQYHPNNKLVKGGAKKRDLTTREHPTFSGRPWIASELGTIAHLVGSDMQPPQLKKAPAQPLPAAFDCRIVGSKNSPIYLREPDESLIIKKEPLTLPEESDKDEDELPTLVFVDDKDELPTLVFVDNKDELPTLIEKTDLVTSQY